MATSGDLCDSCRNGPDDLYSWEGIAYCECCEMHLCDRCYSWLHLPFGD